MVRVIEELQGFRLAGFVLVIITSAGQGAAITEVFLDAAVRYLAALAGGKQHTIQPQCQEVGDELFFLLHLLIVPLDGVAPGAFHLAGVEHKPVEQNTSVNFSYSFPFYQYTALVSIMAYTSGDTGLFNREKGKYFLRQASRRTH